jgi:hypothetical protein
MTQKYPPLILCLLCCAISPALTACNNLEDQSHYTTTQTTITNKELKIVSQTSEQYLRSRQDLTAITALFQDAGIFRQLQDKAQLSTLLVVTNDNYNPPTNDTQTLAKAHVSDIAISPANLTDGTRLMMWHGKYVNITISQPTLTSLPTLPTLPTLKFNNATVTEVIKTTTGYIYILTQMISTPTSLYDYINNLPPQYTIFRNLLLQAGTKQFDRNNSKPIAVNQQGNTIYDSIFIYRNTFLENAGFDINSESLTATILLPSDSVINQAIQEANKRLKIWKATTQNLGHRTNTHQQCVGCPDSIIKRWIIEAAFHNNTYLPQQIQTKQQVDTLNPIQLSNAIVYNVTKLHIPNNILIYRLKNHFSIYENCTAEQKEEYYKTINLNYKSCDTEVTAWTPWQGVWPLHQNRVIRFDKPSTINDHEGFQLDFTPICLATDPAENNPATVQPFLIPPGTYRLAMGSVQNQNLDVTITLIAEGQQLAQSSTITWGTSTAYHYDRGTTLPDRHPEGYDAAYVREQGGNSRADNYDTDGGPIIDEVLIPDLHGDGSPLQIVLRISCANWAGKTNLKLNHWCLRPTVNNY